MLERSALQPDLARATRATTAFAGALIVCALIGTPLAAQYAATAALGLSMPQLRGAYPQRVLVMAVMISVISGAAFLGGLAAHHLPAAVAGIGLLALLSGIWRHVSTDYGPPLGIDSALLFLLALEGPSHGASAGQIALWTALGGTGAAVLQLGLWAFRPQHPLRHAVADAWVAASDLYLALIQTGQGEGDGWTMKQRALRDTLDRATAALNSARSRNSPVLISHLEQMVHEAGHLAMQAAAWHTLSEGRIAATGPAAEPARRRAAREAVLKELANLGRSVAITLITHQERNLAATRARIQTCRHLMEVMAREDEEGQARAALPGAGSHRPLFEAMGRQLTSLEASLRPTVEHSDIPATIPQHLPDLSRASMPAIASWLNSVPFPDPALVRYALRMALLTTLAVAAYLHWAVPRGYWMAFAIIVVLQPDYGATRQRAFQRVTGTVAGALLGSATLFVPLPLWLLAGLTISAAFAFAYFLKRRYGLAVFFVTTMIVLLTELHVPVHLDFTIGRLLSNLAGAVLALVAAAWFWPVSERQRFPGLMAAAIRANAGYFHEVAREYGARGAFHQDIIRAKQVAERAASRAAASLQRLLAEPGGDHPEASATGVVTANDRVTRAISALAIQMEAGLAPDASDPAAVVAETKGLLENVAVALESGSGLAEGSVSGNRQECPHPLLAVLTEVRALELAARGGVGSSVIR
jgi:hypothetical protein